VEFFSSAVSLEESQRQTWYGSELMVDQCRPRFNCTKEESSGTDLKILLSLQNLTVFSVFFSVSDVSATEAGQYQCVVENAVGSISATASIIVQSLPVIKGLSDAPRTVQIGQSVRLECRAEGDPTPNVVWKRHRLGPANY
jgi:Immunoglobulin I-set domain